MCGIVGIVDWRVAIARHTLSTMCDALAHRGPDNHGLWASASEQPAVGFGHRRLAIVDLSATGHQPMSSVDGQVTVVFNGEIYNYRELAEELKQRGFVFQGRSDTEVLLAAYQAWGTTCVERFNGMWAFALWDSKQRRLFLSRDRLGKKPLFYFQDDRRFVFASEMKALFRHPAVPCTPTEQVLSGTIGDTDAQDEQTSFVGIHRVPAAHNLIIHADGQVALHRYWQIDPQHRSMLRGDDVVERFRELMTDAVQIRLNADVAVGSSLSGGLDSSYIVGLTARLRGNEDRGRHTFSARFDGDPVCDEGRFIEAVAAFAGTHTHAVTPSPEGLIAEVDRLHYHQEEPFVSSSIFAQWEVMRLARSRNVRVLLDGQGADELLAGYPPYLATYVLDLFRGGDVIRAWREYYRYRSGLKSAAPSRSILEQRTQTLSVRQLSIAILQRAVRRFRHAAPAGATAVNSNDRSALWNRLHHHTTRDGLPSLLRYVDRNAMAFGVEVRNPFLDYRLVEFVFSLSDEWRIRDGRLKFLLRTAGHDVLPEPVRNRTDKVGFATPEDRWLRGSLRSWAEGLLFDPRLRQFRQYRTDEVRRDWERHLSGRAHLRRRLWPWISRAVWLRGLDRGMFAATTMQAA